MLRISISINMETLAIIPFVCFSLPKKATHKIHLNCDRKTNSNNQVYKSVTIQLQHFYSGFSIVAFFCCFFLCDVLLHFMDTICRGVLVNSAYQSNFINFFLLTCGICFWIYLFLSFQIRNHIWVIGIWQAEELTNFFYWNFCAFVEVIS